MNTTLELLFKRALVTEFNFRMTEGNTSSPVAGGLLDYAALSQRLGTSEGWVRRNARRTYTQDPIPTVRLGKNVRFDWEKVQAWMKKRSK